MTTQAPRPSDKAEEVLETLWIETFEGNRPSLPLSDPALTGHEEGLAELFAAWQTPEYSQRKATAEEGVSAAHDQAKGGQRHAFDTPPAPLPPYGGCS